MNKKPANYPVMSPADIVRPTRVEIDTGRLSANFTAIKSFIGDTSMMPVLKANAYGHGLVPVARLMEKLGADYIGVAVLEEGILLREEGINIPVLVLGGILGNQIPHFVNYNLTITASSIPRLLEIETVGRKLARKIKVHLKIDTGLERIGVHHYSARPFIETALGCDHIEVEGIYSHFAASESDDLSGARQQLDRFMQVLDIFDRLGSPQPPLRHLANSGAILQLPESYLDMVRPGILLYGIYPAPETKRTVEVKPALSWKSRVVFFKVIRAGDAVGYGSTWLSDHPVRALTVPVGYGDGYFRAMSGKARVLVRGKKYPVVGRISMDQIVVNIESDSCYNGDEVILIGEKGGERITCEDVAAWAGTNPYEILTNINTRVPRIYLS